MRRELIFTQRNRNDIEIALKASQQEREMIQRELLTLRHQLQLKSELQNFKSGGPPSTSRNVTSYNATQTSVQTGQGQDGYGSGPASYRAFSADRMAP